ncbi:MAG: hypothetical protein Q4G71_03885 [Pseudomonadota bacterium]|nr:hypothetical protein [Pseudomonadota bacterium]
MSARTIPAAAVRCALACAALRSRSAAPVAERQPYGRAAAAHHAGAQS